MTVKRDELHSGLVKPGLLSNLICLDEVDSTNSCARRKRYGTDTLIVADSQTGGKGRFGRAWHTGRGLNIAMTLVKEFELRVDELHNTGFLISLTLLRSIMDHYGIQSGLSLKWPNDVLLNGKKVSGFLMEATGLDMPRKLIIAGIGINVNQTEFPAEIADKATSLLNETGIEKEREGLIADFVRAFYAEAGRLKDGSDIIDEWKTHCGHIGKTVRFRLVADGAESTAKVTDIGHDGGIVLQDAEGRKKAYYSGEVSFGMML